MLVRLAVFVALALSCVACGGPPSSNFEGDDEYWTLSANGDVTRPELMSRGGNGGPGHICGHDSFEGDAWYFVAPQDYLGDRSAMYGKLITFDLKQGLIYNQISGRDIVLNGSGLALAYNYRDNNKSTPGRDWTPYRARLDDKSGWIVDDGNGNGPPATEDDLRSVLRNLNAFRIRGEFYDGPNDTACLDNVVFGND